jgi:hypothetical protein
MPREGQTTVTIPTYTWEKTVKYYNKHKKTLKKKGIHSPSKLIDYWIGEKCVQVQVGKQDTPTLTQEKAVATQPHEQKK